MRCNGEKKGSEARERSGNAGKKESSAFPRNDSQEISLHPIFQIVEADDRRLRAFLQMELKTRHSLR